MSEQPNVTDAGPEEGKCCVKFNPPMSIQRYRAVVGVLNSSEFKDKIKRVVDFGCSDMNFLKHLKSVPGVREISVVDQDRAVLEQYKCRAAPLVTDYIYRRPQPLSVALYHGSVGEEDNRLRGYDAVTCIELIEHLHTEMLGEVPHTIFSFIRPKVAIITTPNADFNVMFPTLKNFRHWDHKFEWSRDEFFEWCTGIVTTYPSYAFTTSGIGAAPVGNEDLGHCSQMAVFRLSACETAEEGPVPAAEEPYVLVDRYEHPFEKELTAEMILGEIEYYVRFLAKHRERTSDGPTEVNIPKLMSIPKISRLCGTEESLRNILESGGWTVICRHGVHYVSCDLQQESNDESDTDE